MPQLMFGRPLLTTLAVVAVTLIGLAPTAAWAWSTNPPTVLQYVPFTVSDGSTSLTSVGLSSTNDCNTMINTFQTLSGGATTFTVTATATTVYVCGAAGATPVYTVTINPMSFSPQYAFSGQSTTITFASVTPANSQVRVTPFQDCSGGTFFSGAMDSNRQVAVTLSQNAFVCVTVTAVAANGALLTVNTGLIVVTAAIGFNPIQVVRTDQVTFLLSGAAISGAVVRLSTAADCSGNTVTYTAGGAFGVTIQTTVNVPRGTYQFCVQLQTGGTVFASAGVLTVLQYSATPTTAFQSQPTVFYLTGDSPWTTSAIVTADQGCQSRILGPLLPSITTGSLPAVSLPSLGTYFVCVQTPTDNTKFISATSVVVVPVSSVSLSPDPAVRGLLETLTVTPASSYTLRLTVVGDCTNSYATLTTANTVAQFVISPTGNMATVNTVQVCVLTADGTAVYPIRTMTLRNFVLNYDALLIGTRNITLDNATAAGVPFTISSTSDCASTVGSSYTTPTAVPKRVAVSLPSAGLFYVCMQSLVTTNYNVASFTVNPTPTFAPSQSLTKQPLAITVSNVIPGVVINVGSSCSSGLLFTGTSSGTAHIATVTFPAAGSYVLCVTYFDSQGQPNVFNLGPITVADMTSAPNYFVVGVTSAITFSIPTVVNSGPINSNFFLTSAADCAVTLSPTVGIVNSVATFVTNAVGTFRVCAQTQNGTSGAPYVPAGVVSVISVPAVGVVESFGTLDNVPFHINMSTPYIPNGFLVMNSAVTGSLTACGTAPGSNGVATSGLFDSTTGVSSFLSLPASTAAFVVCVRSPDNVNYLFSRVLTVTRFITRVTSFVIGLPATVSTNPTLPYSFFLSPDNACSPAKAMYPVVVGTVVNAPAGTYAYCATGSSPSTWYSAASNNVSVLIGFGAQIPSGIRGNVPVNITVSSDNAALVRVYLIAGVGRACNLLTDASLVGFTGSSPTRVLITVPPRTNVTVCAISNDGTVAMSVGSIVPLSYTSPAEIVLGSPTDVKSGSLTTGIMRLTTDPQCTLAVGPSLRSVAGGTVGQLFVVSADVSQSFLYWCEAAGLDQLIFRAMDTIGLLQQPTTSIGTPAPSPAPGNITWENGGGNTPPGTPFNLTVDPSVGTNPFLSPYSNCTVRVNYTNGIFPTAEGSAPSYFVCVTSSQGTVYTTLYPTVNVSKFQVNPTAALMARDTTVTFLPNVQRFVAAGGFGVFFATDPQCIGGLFGPVATATTMVRFPAAGRYWTCFSPDGSSAGLVAVASIMVYAPPTATPTNPVGPLRGLPYCFDLSLDPRNATYRIVEGLDTTAVGPLTERRAWLMPWPATSRLASDGQVVPCTKTAASTEVAILTQNSSCMYNTGPLSPSITYALCGPTPVENVLLLANIRFPTIGVSPSAVVADAKSTIVVSPNTTAATVALAAQGKNCAGGFVGKPAVTDQSGAAVLDLSFGTAFVAPFLSFTPGAYDVCLYNPVTKAYYALSSVSISAPVYFSISNNVVTTLVPTQVALLQDLTFPMIMGFSTFPSCTATSNSTASVAPTALANIVILYYNINVNASLYLCAKAPVNGSLISVSLVQFVRPLIQFPSAASACTSLTLGFVSESDPRANAPDAVVALYNGACCTTESYSLASSNVVARAVQSRTLLTLYVSSTSYDQFTPQTAFELCVVVPSLKSCVDLGTMQLSNAQCGLTLAPGGNASTKNTLPPGALVGGAPPDSQQTTIVGISVLAAVFGFLVILAIALCCVCSYRHRKVIPQDEDAVPVVDGHGAEDGEWRDTFDELFKNNRARAPTVETLHSMLNVPMDMKLNVCNELPLPMQNLTRDEALDRISILDGEAFVFDRLQQAYAIEGQDALARTVLAERTTLMDSVVSYWEQQYAAFVEVEEESRDLVKVLEEEERLQLAQLEGAEWRIEMEEQGDRIRRNLDHERTWQSRKRRLMEKSSQMWAHLDPSSALRTPDRAAPTPPQEQEAPQERSRAAFESSTNARAAPRDREYPAADGGRNQAQSSRPPAAAMLSPRRGVATRSANDSLRALTPLENPSSALDDEPQPYVAPSRPMNPLRATSAMDGVATSAAPRGDAGLQSQQSARARAPSAATSRPLSYGGVGVSPIGPSGGDMDDLMSRDMQHEASRASQAPPPAYSLPRVNSTTSAPVTRR